MKYEFRFYHWSAKNNEFQNSLELLIWRNSKAAVIIFVKNKDFSSVIGEVKSVISSHPNYVKFVDEKDDTWQNYIFHINDNPSREIKLAVLLFHIPPAGKDETGNS